MIGRSGKTKPLTSGAEASGLVGRGRRPKGLLHPVNPRDRTDEGAVPHDPKIEPICTEAWAFSKPQGRFAPRRERVIPALPGVGSGV